MSRQAAVENEHITVWIDPSNKLVHHQMHKPCYREVFRQALSIGVECMRREGATKWLSDDRLNGALPPEDEEWAKTVWFPATLKAGWKYWALVPPASVVGQMNMRRFTESYATLGITVRVFTDPRHAEDWLISL
ncbi:MAG: hypothetical protein QM778_27965 [Myxococcales bacterium]